MAQRGPDIVNAKMAMRARAGTRRREIFNASGGQAAHSVARIGLGFLKRGAPGLAALYHPVNSEFDGTALMQALSRAGWRTGLPVVTAKDSPLTFRLWQMGDALEPGDHDIPIPAKTAATFRPDVILLPLLAFDQRGTRLGYGGGYYDRTLAMLRKAGPVQAVGLGFAGQEVGAVPHDALDQRLDWILTETGPVRCPAMRGS